MLRRRFVRQTGVTTRDFLSTQESEARFLAYVPMLASVIGHKDHEGPLRDYSVGLLTAHGRKSVEPLAVATTPARVSQQHQSLLHFIGQAPWFYDVVLAKVRELTLPAIESHGPIEAWTQRSAGAGCQAAARPTAATERGAMIPGVGGSNGASRSGVPPLHAHAENVGQVCGFSGRDRAGSQSPGPAA